MSEQIQSELVTGSFSKGKTTHLFDSINRKDEIDSSYLAASNHEHQEEKSLEKMIDGDNQQIENTSNFIRMELPKRPVPLRFKRVTPEYFLSMFPHNLFVTGKFNLEKKYNERLPYDNIIQSNVENQIKNEEGRTKIKQKLKKKAINQKNQQKILPKEYIINDHELEESGKPYIEKAYYENQSRQLDLEKSLKSQTYLKKQNLLHESKLDHYLKTLRNEININSFDANQNELIHGVRGGINSNYTIDQISLPFNFCFKKKKKNRNSSEKDYPHPNQNLSYSNYSNLNPNSKYQIINIQKECDFENYLNTQMKKIKKYSAESPPILNDKNHKEVTKRENSYSFQVYKKEPKSNEIFKRTILSYLFGQISVLIAWEKTFKDYSKNEKVFPFRKSLLHDFQKFDRDFWFNKKEIPENRYCKSNFYAANQYTKFYIWMRSIIEIQTSLFRSEEADKFINSIPPEYMSKIFNQKDFINTMIKGKAFSSFNQFSIAVDSVFASRSEINELKVINAINKKKLLKYAFKEGGIIAYRRKITKDDFVNKVYLSLMNEFVIRCIYPQIQTQFLLKEESTMPIETVIAKRIADSFESIS